MKHIVFAAACGLSIAVSQAADKPNILIIFPDHELVHDGARIFLESAQG